MAKAYRFRVLVDYEQDVFRDIELRSDQSFEILHLAIQEAFEFDASQMASFYMSNDEWEKGEEIALFDMSDQESDSPMKIMSDVLLEELVRKEDQKILYVFDFLVMWCFYIELVKTSEADDSIPYPMLISSYGETPDQYGKNPEESHFFEDTFGEPDSDVEEDEEDQ